jgi:hypothetical protein
VHCLCLLWHVVCIVCIKQLAKVVSPNAHIAVLVRAVLTVQLAAVLSTEWQHMGAGIWALLRLSPAALAMPPVACSAY